VEFYKQVADPGDTILSMHVTAMLSGTFASAELAKRELADQYNIIPIDSAGGSAEMGYMCRDARIMERGGATIDEIVEHMNFIARNIEIVLTLDTMEYARKSGRVKALQAALASLLNVKPIVILGDGVLELGDRVRTRSKSLDLIVDILAKRMGDRLVNAAAVHSEDPQAGEHIMQALRSRLNCKDLIKTELSIGLAANLGPGTVGVIAYPVEGE
jgi:DegV family protein with EDD domain